MKAVLWLLLGVVVGGIAGWYAHALSVREVRAVTHFKFNDKLADPQVPYLSVSGTWRGPDLANKVNAVDITCHVPEMTCDRSQADLITMSGTPFLSLLRNSFRITKLDAQTVTAEPILPSTCIRIILTFDRVAKAVTFTRTKINHEDMCSMVQNEPVTLFLGEPL